MRFVTPIDADRKALTGRRAAQYVLMSTDMQIYSVENQAAAIAAYATKYGLDIVRTYKDAGRSGLALNNREALKELISDLTSGKANYSHVLVYDVSRWGRFQDINESAHCEFICKRAGIKIAYCAELFDNDGSLISSILRKSETSHGCRVQQGVVR